MTVSAVVGTKSASAKSTTTEATPSMEAAPSVATSVTAGSGRYGWRNQANCRHGEQGDDRFIKHMFPLLGKKASPDIATFSEQDCSNDQRATVARRNPLKSNVWLVPDPYRTYNDADGDADVLIA
jgi:hypothetical protein